MRRDIGSYVSLTALVLVLAAAVACGPSTPEGKIAQQRAQYTALLTSFKIVEPEPAEEMDAAAMEEGMEEGGGAGEDAAGEDAAGEDAAGDGGEEAGEDMAEGGGEEMAAAGPQTVNVHFDLVINFRGDKPLDGITVDITHASPGEGEGAETEKAAYQHYIDVVKGMVNGDARQADFILEIPDVADGDVFAASVKSGVPADLSAYPEFSNPGS